MARALAVLWRVNWALARRMQRARIRTMSVRLARPATARVRVQTCLMVKIHSMNVRRLRRRRAVLTACVMDRVRVVNGRQARSALARRVLPACNRTRIRVMAAVRAWTVARPRVRRTYAAAICVRAAARRMRNV